MNLKDHEIIDLFFERSEQAITELVDKYGRSIRSIAWNILNNPQDVEECSNDTYLQVWNLIPPNRPKSLGAYACRIARNLCLKRYHTNTAQKRNSYYDVALQELEDTVPALSTVETDMEARELTHYLNRYLAQLNEKDRYMFLRRCWYGDGVGEISQNLNTTPHAVSVRLFRIRERLQLYLQKEGMIG